MPTLFAADFACGREPMFSRQICRPDGLAPKKKRKARNMSIDDARLSLATSVTRTSTRPTRRAYQAVLSCCGAVKSFRAHRRVSSPQRRRHVREVRTMSLTDAAAHAASGAIKPMTKPTGPVVRQHHPHAGDGCGTGSQLRSPRNTDGAGAGGRIVCGNASCASTPAIRSGPTVTVSCCRLVTRRCCFTRCCT